MATYRFPRMLTLLTWEAELRHGSYADERAWSQPSAADPLRLDFSRVEFADFGALARALLLLDTAVRSEIPATVTLPVASAPTASGQGVDPSLTARQARARGDALAFMRQVGFLDSLRAPHWRQDAVHILDGSSMDGREPVSWPGSPDQDPQNAPYRHRRVFPFRWLEPMPAAQLRESESFLAVSAGLEDLGLSQSDARTLSQTVLTELVENVAKHGGVGDRSAVALVGAIMVGAETYALRQNGMHPHMADITERALADGSQVLRMIVADSGADLTARLAPLYSESAGRGALSDRSRQETILNALGNLSARSVEVKDAQRGTTGLWWVARVVRSYHGGVQARTADLLVGRLFGREAGGTDVAEGGFGHVPGTLLELTLPTGPSPPRPRTSWESQSALGSAPRLSWLSCAFDSRRGLADADRSRLADQVRSVQADRHVDGLIATVPLHEAGQPDVDDGWRGAMYQLLEFASSIARSCTFVVAFPDAESHMLDPCVAMFNEELAVASGEGVHDPILVLGRNGDPVWCGGSVPLRAVLNELSGGAGAADFGAAQRCWHRAGGDPARFSEMLRVNGHLLSVGRSRLLLRLSLAVVHGTIDRVVSQSLAEAVERGGRGVELGVFRGPSLRVTNRWIYVEPLLAGTIGVQLAAFVLARKAEAALRAAERAETPTAIFQVKSAPRLLARQLSECLSLAGRVYPQPSELNIGEPPIGEQLPVGAKVVLCADTIRSEDTVRQAVAIVAGRDADPLVIACVVDARDTRGPVRLLNRTIPVVSLTEIDIAFKGSWDENVTDIDPLLLRPEVAVAGETARAQQTDLLTWFAADPDLLRLGHIDDPPRRHYSAFIRLQAMRQQRRRLQITESVLSNVRTAFAEIRAQGGPHSETDVPIAIWYVASDGNAETLAGIVHDYLAADGFQVGAVTPVPRWIAGDGWAFPASLTNVNRPAGVLIIHWWAITGSTLLQLIRLAAKSGASWITAVCMLNQLDANDADALRMLRAVSVPTMAADGTPSTGDSPFAAQIPVTIRFVAGSGITAFDIHGCPICATRERYRLDEDTAPPRLISHAELLRDTLRARELDEVARDSAADLFTVPVTGYEAIDYLRWRRLLLRALRKVSGRQEVIDRLRVLTGETSHRREWTSTGLIRLLAAEQQWLRLPPLHFEIAAELLSQVCVSCLEQVTTPPWLRVQALMVMSAAVPQRLVELLPKLLDLAGNETVLVDQMLLDCCRLLLRSPGDSPIDVINLRRNLMICRDYLEDQRSEPDTMATEDHLHAVRNLLTVADYRILDKPKDAQAAWERLREDLVRPVVRHRLEAELLLVRSFVEDIEEVEPSPEAAQAASADWDTCARQLEERALANLPPLRDILGGDFVADWLGGKDQRRLLTLAHPDVGELRAVTDRLQALAHGPWRPAEPSWQAVRHELLGRINWWNRIFLAAHLSDQQVPALLVELVRSAPIKLGPCVEKLLRLHQAQAAIDQPEGGDVEVFCPEKLLDQIITHLLENIEKHCVKGAVCRLQIEYLRPARGTAQMVVRNSGTLPSTPPGRGLKALSDKLRPFGGSLIGQVLADDEWTFAAVATLPLWHGG